MKARAFIWLLLVVGASGAGSGIAAADTGWMQPGVRVWYLGAVGSGGASSNAEETYIFDAVVGTNARVVHHSAVTHWTLPNQVETSSYPLLDMGPCWIHPTRLQTLQMGDHWMGNEITLVVRSTTYGTLPSQYQLLPTKALIGLNPQRGIVKLSYMIAGFSTGNAYFDADTGIMLFYSILSTAGTTFFMLAEINYDFARQAAFAEDYGPHTGFKSIAHGASLGRNGVGGGLVIIQSLVETRYGATVEMRVLSSYTPSSGSGTADENYCFFGDVPIVRRMDATLAPNYPPEQWNPFGQYLWWWLPPAAMGARPGAAESTQAQDAVQNINVFNVPMVKTSDAPLTYVATQTPAAFHFSTLWFDSNGYMTAFAAKGPGGLDVNPGDAGFLNGTTVNGADYFLTVMARPVPTVTTNAATNVGQGSAELSATVNPKGSSTTLYFDYGRSTSYGSTVTYGSIGSGTTAVTQAYTLGGLNCGTLYQYRARAQNSNGTTNGGNRNLTTSACTATSAITWATPASINAGTPLSATQLNATAAANGSPVPGTFVYTPPIGTVMNTVGTQTLSVAFTPTNNAYYSTATATVNLVVLPVPTLIVSPATLRFAGTNTSGTLSPITSPQTVTVTFRDAAAPSWTAAANQSWVQITNGSGTGSGTFRVGIVNPGNVLGSATSGSATITVTAAGVSNSPQTVAVALTLQPSVLNKPPIGLVDSPSQNATGQVGAIGVTGWVVDDVGIKSVTLYRNCLAFEPALNCAIVNGVNLVYIGDATIVTGARPDIEIAYPAYPQNNRAAWGYLLLTSMLPHLPNQQMFGGQGTLTLYVLAEDLEGHKRWLGRDFITAPSETNQTPTTFTMANDTIAKPFGAIDTPAQGQTVSGSFWNFGWTLTPDSNALADADDILMPLTGATQWVYIDGVAVAPLGAYNLCRGTVNSPPLAGEYCDDDVSNIFGNPTPQPTFTTRTANPTKHRNLDAGRGPIAAYYLDTTTLSNGVHTIVWGATDSAGRGEGIGSRYFTVLNGSFDSRPAGTALAQDRSFDSRAADPPQAGVDGPVGARHAVPVRRALGSPRSSVAGTGAGLEPGDPRQSPVTQTAPMQAADAVLREAPAAARGEASALETLVPPTGPVWGRTGYDVHTPYAEVAADEAGVRHVQIRDLGRLELWLGAVERGYLVANGTLRDLPPGSSLNVDTGAFTWSPGLGYLGTYRLAFVRGGEQIPVEVTIRPMAPTDSERDVRMAVDVPRTGEIVSGAITVAGWALDPQAWTGSGIDAVHVWAQRVDVAAAAPQFLGAAALGGVRPDVAKVHGPTFNSAGFSLTTDALAPGQYDVTVFAWNHRTARWEDSRTVRVTVR